MLTILKLKFNFACIKHESIYCITLSFALFPIEVKEKLVWVHLMINTFQ